jgi:hypothetical protein
MGLKQRQAYGERAFVFWDCFIIKSIERPRPFIQPIGSHTQSIAFPASITDPMFLHTISGTGDDPAYRSSLDHTGESRSARDTSKHGLQSCWVFLASRE